MINHTYFSSLNQELKQHYRAIPCLLIDLDRLDENITILKKNLKEKANFRIVVKSLPSPELIHYVMQKATTSNLMLFHQPFLTDISHRSDEKVDILLGKPMPVKTAAYYYETMKNCPSAFNPFRQVQWLVDTPKRISEYIALAKSLNQKLRLNLEIDVGLHRGGFMDLESLSAALRLIQNNTNRVELSGLMGYDPHVVKLPKLIRPVQKALQLANSFYRDCQDLIRVQFSDLWQDNLTFNGAGSPTISLHQEDSPLNDVSAGSCLVKPSTFDLPTLSAYQPACFIAAPVLKKLEGTTLPTLEGWKRFWNLIHQKHQQSYFIYGGFWKADYCWPLGLEQNAVFGPSTNQTMLNAPTKANLNVDDFVFLKPHQSEFVFLQFGEILTIRAGKITSTWSLLEQR